MVSVLRNLKGCGKHFFFCEKKQKMIVQKCSASILPIPWHHLSLLRKTHSKFRKISKKHMSSTHSGLQGYDWKAARGISMPNMPYDYTNISTRMLSHLLTSHLQMHSGAIHEMSGIWWPISMVLSSVLRDTLWDVKWSSDKGMFIGVESSPSLHKLLLG